MNTDNSNISKIKNMNEEQFREAAKKIAEQLGLDKRSVDMITKNSEKVKRKLDNMSSSDIDRAISKIGEDKLAEIINGTTYGRHL